MTCLCNLALSFWQREGVLTNTSRKPWVESGGSFPTLPDLPTEKWKDFTPGTRGSAVVKTLASAPSKDTLVSCFKVFFFLRVLERFVTKDNAAKFLFDLEREDGQVLCSSNNSFTFWNFPFLVRSIALFLFDARFVSLPLVSNCGENASIEKKYAWLDWNLRVRTTPARPGGQNALVFWLETGDNLKMRQRLHQLYYQL